MIKWNLHIEVIKINYYRLSDFMWNCSSDETVLHQQNEVSNYTYIYIYAKSKVVVIARV